MQPRRSALDGFGPLVPDDARVGVARDLVLGANAELAFAATRASSWGPLEAWAHGLDLFVVTLDATYPGSDAKPWHPRVFAGPHCLDRIPRGRQTLCFGLSEAAQSDLRSQRAQKSSADPSRLRIT